MSLQAPTDVPVLISVASDRTEGSLAPERRITPSWPISVLKAKLETMTGIPPGYQKLRLKAPGREDQWVEGEEKAIGDWGLSKGCEIEITDTRPPGARPDFGDLSSVEKYTLPAESYETMSNTVLSWKKQQKLGRFDPDAASPEEMLAEQVEKERAEIKRRGLEVGKRAVIEPSTHRRGTLRYIGTVPTIPSTLANKIENLSPDQTPLWVGIELDEPTGKNDGSVGGQRYFTCPNNTGAFVKPEKVRVGDYPQLGLDDELDEDMEEI